MNIAYWVLAALLALFYVYAGGKKATQSKDQLLPMMGWVDRTPMPLVRVIGVLEVAGGIGLILPPLTGIAVGLATAAAIGLTLIQVGGIVVHVSRGEARLIGLNVGLLVAGMVTAALVP
ncbi:DoxX family protein [Actinoplanes couchii]|uniref:Membrane protein n=1 Tax=Actinoplanes couchii TaxID=403638 RepID=A0ABQ3XGM8_9ACTN|nr:DoxX family protein [Actinoplanes couchii]MDR6320861.1 putative membrane protein [Actinoplanes couchii]GID57654.1 membrane protein [Actinoplanes couchii]